MPVERNQHLSTRIAREIRKAITSGRIEPGERLPPEHLLSATFGVSRSVVREAIAQLRNEGLIETRQGVGAFASIVQMPHFLRIEPGEKDHREAIRCLYQLRIPLEVKAAGLAAMLRTDDDLARLDRAVPRMDGAEDTSEHAVIVDLDFHRAIAALTRNHFFPLFIGFILDRIDVFIRATKLVVHDSNEEAFKEHAEILHALHARDSKSAERAMQTHLSNAANRLSFSPHS